jgi:hypothetical protein
LGAINSLLHAQTIASFLFMEAQLLISKFFRKNEKNVFFDNAFKMSSKYEGTTGGNPRRS